ncbi:hypothetical protein [Lewinella sp. 4G2]|uniref:hypothetical protein n=1 Tax=Lewinella sp. 4G2 TaxID=1803372 RepID=UPI0007B4B46B|nr:hypothetical protein [Lewinella sp. 4G2]OAV45441.1 hypothetical protein A3850_013490 [Lewinella sp. 4G2]
MNLLLQKQRMGCMIVLLTIAQVTLAQSLPTSLRSLVPGETPAAANERQYLYAEFRDLYQDLRKEEKLDRRSTKKKIKKMRSYLEDEVFRHYDAKATLTDVFRSGSYNDATAASVMALALNEFEVDYDLYVDHFYVRLETDPDGKDIDVNYYVEEDITSEAKESFRSNYLILLGETLLPDLKERSPQDPFATFKEYYYNPSQALSLKQLGAYLQLRYAQVAYGEENFARSQSLLELAEGNDSRAAFLVFEKAVELASQPPPLQYESGSLDEMFAVWQANPDHATAPPAILRHFDEQQRIILATTDPGKTRNLLADYLERAPDGQTEWTSQMMQLQGLRMMEHYIAVGDLRAARLEAAELYQGFPEVSSYKQMLSNLIIAEVNKESLSGQAFKQRLLQLSGTYPFLLNSGQFANEGLREQALTIRDLYAGDRPDLALPAVEDFRRSVGRLSVNKIRSIWTLTAFYAASDYHFRIADYPGALRFIDEALSYAPNDPFLNHRRSVLVKYL